jgi:hypothetical protein
MDQKSYSQEEVDHMVAREVAKQRMSDLERNLENTNSQVVKMFAKFDVAFENLQRSIDSQDTKIRAEMERDFATKIEMTTAHNTLDKKIDSVWYKVSIPVGTLLVVISILEHLLVK